jgi:transposase
MKSLHTSTILEIVSLLDSGYSVREVASRTKSSIGTVSLVRNQHRPDMPKALGGRPRKLTEADVRLGMCYISAGKADTAVQVQKVLQNATNQSLSDETVRRYLREGGMKSVVKKKRPFLSARHQREHLDFAIAHKDWTLEDWKRVVWSDETKINRFGSDGRKWAWKRAGEGLSARLVAPTLKFGGGSIMMWGCFCWNGVGYGCKIDGRMDANLYCQILEEELQQSLGYYGLNAGK